MGSDLPFIVTGPRYSKWNCSSKFSPSQRILQIIENVIRSILFIVIVKLIYVKQYFNHNKPATFIGEFREKPYAQSGKNVQ